MPAEKTSGQILQSVLIAVIRHGLSIVAAWLISKGLVAPELLSEGNLLILAGGIATAVISVGWIIYNKLKTHNLVQAAMEASPRASMSDVKEAAAAKPLLGN